MSAATQQAFQALLSNQMEAFAAHMASQFPALDSARIVAMAKEHCSGLNLVEATAKIPKKRGPKKARTSTPRATPEPGCRCMARVWQSGSGHDQCAKSRVDGDYCKAHAKKAAICPLAVQVADEGKNLAHVPAKLKIGLWCGRIDEFQDGREGIPPYKDSDGIIRIEWSSDEMRAVVEADIEAGTARFAGEGAKKTTRQKTKTPEPVQAELADDLAAANAQPTELMDALNTTDGDVYDAETDHEDATDEPVAVPEPVVEAAKEPEPEPEPVAVPEPVVEAAKEPEPVDVPEDDLEALMADDGNGAADGDDELEVEERVHDGVTHYVDPNSNDIWDIEEGEIIGKWVDGAPVFNK